MLFYSKKIQVFFVSFLISFSSLFSSIGGGILPYVYYKGEAYIFVACGQKTPSKVWGDFGISSIKQGENVYAQISRCAHFGTFGMFSDITDKLFKEDSDIRELALLEDIEFFSKKMKDKNCKHFLTKHTTNNHGDLLYNLFFVEVPFVPAHFFMEKAAYLRINFAELFINYGGKNGFAWISVKNLLGLAIKLNSKKIPLSSKMRFRIRTQDRNSNFFDKPSDLSYEGCDLLLNEYLSEEFRTFDGIAMLQKILDETPTH